MRTSQTRATHLIAITISKAEYAYWRRDQLSYSPPDLEITSCIEVVNTKPRLLRSLQHAGIYYTSYWQHGGSELPLPTGCMVSHLLTHLYGHDVKKVRLRVSPRQAIMR